MPTADPQLSKLLSCFHAPVNFGDLGKARQPLTRHQHSVFSLLPLFCVPGRKVGKGCISGLSFIFLRDWAAGICVCYGHKFLAPFTPPDLRVREEMSRS